MKVFSPSDSITKHEIHLLRERVGTIQRARLPQESGPRCRDVQEVGEDGAGAVYLQRLPGPCDGHSGIAIRIALGAHVCVLLSVGAAAASLLRERRTNSAGYADPESRQRAAPASHLSQGTDERAFPGSGLQQLMQHLLPCLARQPGHRQAPTAQLPR